MSQLRTHSMPLSFTQSDIWLTLSLYAAFCVWCFHHVDRRASCYVEGDQTEEWVWGSLSWSPVFICLITCLNECFYVYIYAPASIYIYIDWTSDSCHLGKSSVHFIQQNYECQSIIKLNIKHKAFIWNEEHALSKTFIKSIFLIVFYNNFIKWIVTQPLNVFVS